MRTACASLGVNLVPHVTNVDFSASPLKNPPYTDRKNAAEFHAPLHFSTNPQHSSQQQVLKDHFLFVCFCEFLVSVKISLPAGKTPRQEILNSSHFHSL